MTERYLELAMRRKMPLANDQALRRAAGKTGVPLLNLPEPKIEIENLIRNALAFARRSQ